MWNDELKANVYFENEITYFLHNGDIAFAPPLQPGETLKEKMVSKKALENIRSELMRSLKKG